MAKDYMNNKHDNHIKVLEERLQDYDLTLRNAEYSYRWNRHRLDGEIDLYAKKDNYILIFEYKCNGSHKRKAMRQLSRAKDYLSKQGRRVFMFYVYGQKNEVEWITDAYLKDYLRNQGAG